MVDMESLPGGYVLVKDVRLINYNCPPGHRVERRARVFGPRRRVGEGRTGGEVMDRIRTFLERVEGEEGVPKGTFVPFSTSSRPPRLLAEKMAGKPEWVWLSSLGGYIRVADEAKGMTTPMVDFELGDFFVDGSNAKIPGFATGIHPGFQEGVKVRIAKEHQNASLRLQSMKGGAMPPAPPVLEGRRADLIERIKALYRDAGGDPSAALAWAEKAPLEKVEAWLAESEGGAK